MGARHRARQAALQVLFALDMNPGQNPGALLSRAREELGGEVDEEYAGALVQGVREHQEALDAVISEASRRWRVERMGRVDRNVLRLAAYELMFLPDTPAPVILDEAVDLAREFGTEDSPRFVNGLLDRIARQRRPGEVRGARGPS